MSLADLLLLVAILGLTLAASVALLYDIRRCNRFKQQWQSELLAQMRLEDSMYAEEEQAEEEQTEKLQVVARAVAKA